MKYIRQGAVLLGLVLWGRAVMAGEPGAPAAGHVTSYADAMEGLSFMLKTSDANLAKKTARDR